MQPGDDSILFFKGRQNAFPAIFIGSASSPFKPQMTGQDDRQLVVGIEFTAQANFYGHVFSPSISHHKARRLPMCLRHCISCAKPMQKIKKHIFLRKNITLTGIINVMF
jgi:hypothetical protein